MSLKRRTEIFGVGLLVAAYGWVQLNGYHWAYNNHYSLTVYSPAVIATGMFIAALALLPAGGASNTGAARRKDRRLKIGYRRRRK